jgi:ribosomal protein L33
MQRPSWKTLISRINPRIIRERCTSALSFFYKTIGSVRTKKIRIVLKKYLITTFGVIAN